MAYSLPPLINGKANEWADIVVNVLGSPLTSITGLEYEDNQEMENIYGAGNRPVARAYGNFKPTAKLTINMEELEGIQAIAPNGDIQRIPEFDITVVYFDPALPVRTHTIHNCRFMNNTRKSAQGDTSIPVELNLIISHVSYI